MKKMCYLCAIMMLSTNLMAQIDPNDKNWDTLFIEDFSGNRSWSILWEDLNDSPNYVSIWKCFADEYWGSGVTTGINDRQAYRPENAIFSSNNTMKLIGEFNTSNKMWCGEDGVGGEGRCERSVRICLGASGRRGNRTGCPGGRRQP